MTLNLKTNARIVFSDPKNINKCLLLGDLAKLIFFKMASAAILDFSENEALRMPLEVVFFDFMKRYTLMNKPSKWHYCTMICSG